MPTDKAELTNEQQAALESLGKKRCLSCQEPLKIFYPAEITAPFAWLALGFYEKYLRGEMPPFVPASGHMALAELVFASACAECGNVSMWKLTKEEIDVFYDEALAGEGYKLLDLFDEEWVKKAYEKCNIPNLTKRIIAIVEASKSGEKGR